MSRPRVSDFSRGIIRDPDLEERPIDSLEDCTNYRLLPGRVLKRYGTSAKTFVIRGDAINTIPKSDEFIVAVELLDSPMAKEDSIDGPWPNLTEYPGTGDVTNYFHNQPAVTVILVRVTDGVTAAEENRYRLYADIWVKDEFDLITYGPDSYFYAIDADTIPHMIPRKNGVAIGGVLVDLPNSSETEPGVLWFGHIKKQWGWARTDGGGGSSTYAYTNDIDRWALTNSERYNGQDELRVRLGVGSLERAYRAGSTPNDDIDDTAVPAKTVLRRHVDPIMLGGHTGPAKIRMKVTAKYDWYQESRPLRFAEDIFDLVSFESFTDTIDLCEDSLPYGWNFRSIDDGRGVELQLGRTDIEFTVLSKDLTTLRQFGSHLNTEKYTGSVLLRWRHPYDENTTNRYHGEAVPLFVNQDTPGTAWRSSHGRCWTVEWNAAQTVIEKLILRPNYFPWADSSPFDDTTAQGIYRSGSHVHPGTKCWPWVFLMYLLGMPPVTSRSDDTSSFTDGEYWVHHAWYGWYDYHGSFHQGAEYSINNLPTVNNFREWKEYFSLVSGLTDYNAGVTDDGYDSGAVLYVNDSVALGTFGLNDENGKGFCFIRPYLDTKHLTNAQSAGDHMKYGLNRLTSFCFYLMEMGVDADYRMISEVHLDESPYDRNHHGVGYEVLGDRPYDEQEGTDASTGLGDAPVWMTGTLDGISALSPAFHPSISRFLTGMGLVLRGFVYRKFIVSNDVVRTKEGAAILSQRMLRDESERDNPLWKRGSVCTKRILGANAKTGQCQYSLIAGGIPQWDICPGDIEIDMNDVVTHVVTWRGNHHLVFTDKALWRIDMTTSDELTWRIMNTFWHSGTTLYRTIQVVPVGVFFVNQEGIWMYRGDLPESLILNKWQLWFDDQYSGELLPLTCTAGYNKKESAIYLCAGKQVEGLQYVWLFDVDYMRWRRYLYASGRPYYMTYHDKEFLLSAAPNDCWKVDYSVFTDKGSGYLTVGRTQYLSSRSQVHHDRYTHLGVDYKQRTTANYSLRVRVYQNEYMGSKLTTNPKVRLPNSRKHYFFPLPFGHLRLLQIEFGQGAWFLDANSDCINEFCAFTLRGAPHEQWDQTNTGSVGSAGEGDSPL